MFNKKYNRWLAGYLKTQLVGVGLLRKYRTSLHSVKLVFQQNIFTFRAKNLFSEAIAPENKNVKNLYTINCLIK